MQPTILSKDNLSRGLTDLLKLASIDFEKFWNQLCKRSRDLTNSVCDPQDYQNTIVIYDGRVYGFCENIEASFEVFYLCDINQLEGNDVDAAEIIGNAMSTAYQFE